MQCVYCKSSSNKIIISFKDIDVVKCRECGLVQMNPISTKINGDDYKELDVDKFVDYIESIRKPQFKKDLEVIYEKVKSGKVLDIGCSTGLFLNLAKEKGFEVYGIEPAKTIFDKAKQRYDDIDFYNGEFNKENYAQGSFDVITLWSVLEHTIDPVKIIGDCNILLKDNGILAIRVPNYNGLIPRLIIILYKLTFGIIASPAKSLYEYSYEYKHFFHFTEAVLSKVLGNNGFKVFLVKYENSIDMGNFNKRIASSNKKNDLAWMNNCLLKSGVKVILRMAKLLRAEDEMVIFCEKKTGELI